MGAPSCFTFSVQHNAWALARGVERLGYRLEAVSDQSGLVRRSLRQPAPGDVLFFTDERSLLAYAGECDRFRFHPRRMDPRLVDDKLEWARVVQSLGERPVPFWALGDDTPQAAPELPVYLKARHSWDGRRRLPRGYVCRSEGDVAVAFASLAAGGWHRSQFFWQRLVSGPISNNFSVCGFFDAARRERSVMTVVQKILGESPTVMSCGALVETVPDPDNLLERATSLLAALRFTGPFELEFLRDNDTYYVLEFNPRFWMQHGLFVDGYDNAVIARYLGIDVPASTAHDDSFRSVAWLNTIDLLRRLPALLFTDAPRRRVYLDLWRRHRRGQTRLLCSPDLKRACVIVATDRGRDVLDRVRRMARLRWRERSK